MSDYCAWCINDKERLIRVLNEVTQQGMKNTFISPPIHFSSEVRLSKMGSFYCPDFPMYLVLLEYVYYTYVTY